MRKRLIVVLAVVMAVLVVPVGLALAGEADVGGTGWLRARGTGVAVIDGGGHIAMAVDGDVTIVDHAGDAHVVISSRPGTGEEPLASDSEYELENFRGVIRITGSNVTVKAHGRMKFRAVGTGSAFLRGHGWYETRGLHGEWTPAGVRVEIAAVPAGV